MRLLSRLAAERLPFVEEISLDPVVLAFAALLGVVTGVLFGLAPALRGASFKLSASLKEGTRTTGAASIHRMNDAFVVSQVALSVVFLIGAGLLIKSFVQLMDVSPGFEPRNAIVGRIAVPWTTYREMTQVRQLVAGLTDRVRALPGVTAVGVTSTFIQSERQPAEYHRPGTGVPPPVSM